MGYSKVNAEFRCENNTVSRRFRSANVTGVMLHLYNIIPIPYLKIIIFLRIVKVFQGNTDYRNAVGHILDHPIIARFVKINVKTYQGYPSLRVELYGCSDGMWNFFV